MKAEQERVSNLLTDTVTLLCRNGLQYKTEMKVQGLLGITLDNEVFLVHIDKKFGDLIGGELMSLQAGEEEADGGCSVDNDSDGRLSPTTKKRQRTRRKRQKSASGTSTPEPEVPLEKKICEEGVIVKTEPQTEDDDLVMLEHVRDVDSDSKAGLHDKDTMRESYGLASHRLSHVTVENSFMNNVNDDSSQVTDQLPGCSGWEDPLSVLTEQNNSGVPPGGSSSGGDDTMDQQTMSTLASTFRVRRHIPGDFHQVAAPHLKQRPSFWKHQGQGRIHRSGQGQDMDIPARGGRGHFQCPVAGCDKVFSFGTSMYRHKRVVHNIRAKPRTDSVEEAFLDSSMEDAQIDTDMSLTAINTNM